MSETMYRMDKTQSNLLKNFLYVRNNGLLFNKTNVDKNGKPTLFDPDTGRPIYIGDGIIPQVERFASKYAYNKLTVEAFTTAIAMMNEKSENQLVTNMYLFAMRKLGKTYKLVYQNGLQDSKLAELICGLRKLTAMLTLVLHSIL